MTPRLRFVARPHRFSHMWAVYDNLRGYAISEGNNAAMATFMAGTHEASWRARYSIWQQAEHRGSLP